MQVRNYEEKCIKPRRKRHHSFSDKLGYEPGVASRTPYGGSSSRLDYRPADDPDPRAFAYLQVELALDTLGEVHRAWATNIYVQNLNSGFKDRRMTTKVKYEVVNLIRRQILTREPETIVQAIMWGL